MLDQYGYLLSASLNDGSLKPVSRRIALASLDDDS